MRELQYTFRHQMEAFSPDNFFGVKKIFQEHAAQLTIRELLPALKLSRFDPRLFSQVLPRLQQLAPDLEDDQAFALLQTCIRVWDNHFPIGEAMDLAGGIGYLLHAIGFEAEGSRFLQLSQQHTPLPI